MAVSGFIFVGAAKEKTCLLMMNLCNKTLLGNKLVFGDVSKLHGINPPRE